MKKSIWSCTRHQNMADTFRHFHEPFLSQFLSARWWRFLGSRFLRALCGRSRLILIRISDLCAPIYSDTLPRKGSLVHDWSQRPCPSMWQSPTANSKQEQCEAVSREEDCAYPAIQLVRRGGHILQRPCAITSRFSRWEVADGSALANKNRIDDFVC